MPDTIHPVLVTDFGAVGDNSHDDGPNIREAHEYCRTAKPGYYLPLHFPIGRYKVDSTGAFPLVNGMHWTGEGHYGDEKEYRSQIKYSKTHMFSFAGNSAPEFMAFTGLCFEGRSQPNNLIEPSTSAQVNYSSWLNCGFKNFNHVFDNAMLGNRIIGCFFQNNLCAGNFRGSDNIIENNYVSGSNWVSGGNSSSAGANTFAMKFGSFRLNRVRNNFITGLPQMPMLVNGDLDGTIFDANWFDICDWSGLALENSDGGIFVNNTFNRCMLGQDAALAKSDTTSTKYDAIVRLINCNDVGFWNNWFGYVSGGLPKGAPIKTFHITGGSGVQIANNLFRAPYKRLDVKD